MGASIPASAIANVIPGVISLGGAALVMNGVVLTNNPQVPYGQAIPFSSAQAVSLYFGATSAEANIAARYFAGYTNCTQLPAQLYFVQYVSAASVSAYTRGASILGLTLAQLQAVTGTLSVTIDGTVKTWAAVNLAAATSQSSAATLIATGLGLSGGQTCTFDPISGGLVITSGSTGLTSTITLPTGTSATALGFTSGVTSQGAVTSTPAGAMNALTGITQNWVQFMTAFEPVLADKLSFALWTSQQNTRYAYIAWDSDVNESVANNTTAFGPQVKSLGYSGTCVIAGDPAAATAQNVTLASLVLNTAAFILGAIASINFNQTNGRITFAFKSQGGLNPTCQNQQTAANLIANGCNFYGAYATANAGFVFFYPGQVGGNFSFLDEYINAIWMANNFQLALMNVATSAPALPYNNDGYQLEYAALQGPVQQAANFGAFRKGVVLSPLEAQEVNQAAGVPIATILFNLGYYLQVKDPGYQARVSRTTPVMNFWYMDGGSAQSFSLASIDVQ